MAYGGDAGCNPIAEQVNPCRFLELPAELRNQIYDTVFDAEYHREIFLSAGGHRKVGKTWHEDTNGRLWPGLPRHLSSLLRANRITNLEAKPILYGTTIFRVAIVGHRALAKPVESIPISLLHYIQRID